LGGVVILTTEERKTLKFCILIFTRTRLIFIAGSVMVFFEFHRFHVTHDVVTVHYYRYCHYYLSQLLRRFRVLTLMFINCHCCIFHLIPCHSRLFRVNPSFSNVCYYKNSNANTPNISNLVPFDCQVASGCTVWFLGSKQLGYIPEMSVTMIGKCPKGLNLIVRHWLIVIGRLVIMGGSLIVLGMKEFTYNTIC